MNELQEILDNSGLEIATKQSIKRGMNPFFEQFEEIAVDARALIVTDESQTDLMADAKKWRLKFVKIRTASGKIKDLLKKDSKIYEKTVMSVYKLIVTEVEKVERHLEKQEKFAAILKAQRVDKLDKERAEIAKDLIEWIPRDVTFGKLSDEEFERILNSAKLTKNFELEESIRKNKEAKELLRKQVEEAEERNRLRVENEKLRAEIKLKEDIEKEHVEKPVLEIKKLDTSDEKEILLDYAKQIRNFARENLSEELKDFRYNKMLVNTKFLLEKVSIYIEENV